MEYPEHDKVAALQPAWQDIGVFLDWLMNESDYHICVWGLDEWTGDELFLAKRTENELIAEFYGVDLKAYEEESRLILAQQRALNAGPLDEPRFGVTWATKDHSIAQTGYVYTYDQAMRVAGEHPSRAETVVDIMCLCELGDHSSDTIFGRVEDTADAYGEVLVRDPSGTSAS